MQISLDQLVKIAQQIKATALQEKQKNIQAAQLMDGAAIGVDTLIQEVAKLSAKEPEQEQKKESDAKAKSSKPRLQKK